ncbi:MAG TPA: hypothetical protein VHD36_05095 [Pirellulales bacterium]|nr:hypothetical protein [Pirellulales bacterium]
MRHGPASILWAVVSLSAASAIGAQPGESSPREQPPAAAAGTLRFRRVYAPAERVQDWPRGTARYVPVDGPEFERLVKAAQEESGDRPAPACLEQADYTAQFDGIDRLQGTFAWEVERTVSSAAPVNLSPLNLALGKTRWSDSPQPVELGLDEDGEATLIADRAGTVTGTWSLRGRHDNDGQLAFRFELPRAALSTLLLTVPPGVVPTAGSGVASLVEEQADRHVYRLLLGGASELSLRLPLQAAAVPGQPKVLMRESAVYNLSPRGVDLAAVWKLDVHSTPVHQLEVVLDPGLQLVLARLGESEVPFTTLAANGQESSRILLNLPDALSGSDRPLRLSAIGPLPAGKSAPLPRIRAADCTWQEGTCTVLVHEPLVAQRLATRDCRQTKYSSLPEPNRGESFEIQWFSATSTVELDLAREKPRTRLSTGLLLELDDDLAKAQLVAMAQGVRGRCLSLVADVGSAWLIDAVDAEPRDALDGWHVNTEEEVPELTIRFSRPLPTDSPVKLMIRAHRAASNRETWPAGELEVVRFRNVDIDEQWLSLQPAPGRAIALAEVENLVRITGDVPLTALQNIFQEAPKHPVYRFDPLASRFSAKIVDERPAFAAKIAITAQVNEAGVSESCSLRCQPDDDPVSRVLVRFSASRPEPPRFELAGEGQAALVARRVVSAVPEVSDEGETWEILLARPQSAGFEIHCERVTPFADQIAVGLVNLPDAVTQQAQVTVDAAADVSISVEASGLTPLAVSDDPGMPGTRGVFQYNRAEPADKIVVTRQHGSLGLKTAGIVWHRRTESHYDVAGNSWHTSTFRLQNSGQSSVTVTVPERCEITLFWRDGRSESASGAQVRVDLPSDANHVTLSVEYRGPAMAGLKNMPLTAPVATIDMPVVSSDWVLWLPTGFALGEVAAGSAKPAVTGLSWSERLFGPLGRSKTTLRFAPFSSKNWSALGSRLAGDDAAASYAMRFEELARSQAQALVAPTWASLLAAAAESSQQSGAVLRIDAAALAAKGIGPRSQLVPSAADLAGRPASSLLAQNDVALLFSPDAVLLTSREAASLHRDELRWIEPDQLGMLDSGPLLSTIVTRTIEDEEYPSATIWAQQGQEPTRAIEDTQPLAGDLGAAIPYIIHAEGSSPPVAQIIYPASRSAGRAVACVLALAICLHFVRRWNVLAAWLSIAAAAALLFPEGWAPLATGSLWGIAAAIAWRWLAPPPRREVSSSPSKASTRPLATALPLLLAIVTLAGLGLLPSRAAGQQESKTAPREDSTDDVYRVFIPVDDQEQPTDGKYQVPEHLYDELQRLVARATGKSGGWLIRAARYQLSLARDGLNEGYIATDVRVQYDVLALGSDVVFRLPLLGVRPGPVASREGREIELEWDIDEDGFYCRFDEPGMYQLNLSLRMQRGDATAGALDMAIPPVPHATVIVQLPANLSSVDVPSALGVSALSEDGRTFVAELGATDRLTVRWARTRQPRTTNVAGDAETWLWLQVQPASVIMHARLDLKGLKAPLSELWLSVDPRLRALPVVDRSGTVASVQPVAGDPQTVRVELARPVTDHATVPVSFLLVGSSGIGQLSLPRIEPQGLHVGKRVLAISVEPALEFSVPPPEAKSVMNVGEFLAHWGGAPTPPQSVIQLDPDEPWTLSTRPRNSSVLAQQRLSLSVGQGRALVRFVAEISGGDVPPNVSGYTLQHLVRAPADLEVERVSLVQEGIDRVSRWTRDELGMISVFLSGPVTGRQLLSIEGWLPAPLDGSWPLPRIKLESATQWETMITLQRQPTVQIALADQQGLFAANHLRPDESPLPGPTFAVLRASQNDYSATIRISPNTPRARATLLTTLDRDSAGARGALDYHAVVEDGIVDSIAIDLPAAWAGPFEIAPPAALEVVNGADSIRRLVIRPKTPATGDLQFTLRCRLELEKDRPLAIPTLSGDADDQVFVMLPTKWGTERLHWKTRAMQADRLPEDLARSAPPGGAQVFRVVEADAAAWPAVGDPVSGTAQSMAEIQWFYNAGSNNHGVARFTLDDPGERICHLRWPDAMHILELRVAGRLRTPATSNRTCTIKLPASDQRHTVEVIFASELPATTGGGSVVLTAPFLDGIDFAETTWHIYDTGAQGSATIEESSDLPPLTTVEREFAPGFEAPTAAADSMATRFAFAGNAPQITVQFPSAGKSAILGRWLAALILVLAAIVAARAPYSRLAAPTAPGFVIAGIAAGLAASIWLTPAWIGALIALTSVSAGYWPMLAKSLPQRPELSAGEPSA